MPIVNITGHATRTKAQDYKSVDSKHKPGTKGAPAAANSKASIISGDTSPSNKKYNSGQM
jgi:hypothetical protein